MDALLEDVMEILCLRCKGTVRSFAGMLFWIFCARLLYGALLDDLVDCCARESVLEL